MDVIRKRQSIRHYKEGDVPNDAIYEMIEAARLAPSGKNLQNWHFIVIKNRGFMKRVADAVFARNEEIALKMMAKDEGKASRFRKFLRNFTLFFLDAPVLLVVMTEDYHPSGYWELDLAGADQTELDALKYFRNPGMQSLGAAIEHFELRAFDIGYGCCWLTSANYAAKEIESLLRKEGIFDREGWFMGAMLSLGIPAEGAKSPGRKTRDEISTFIV